VLTGTSRDYAMLVAEELFRSPAVYGWEKGAAKIQPRLRGFPHFGFSPPTAEARTGRPAEAGCITSTQPSPSRKKSEKSEKRC